MKKLILSGIQPAPSTARSAHPLVPIRNDALETLLGQWAEVNPNFKRLKAQNETLAKQTAPLIRALYFETFKGVQPESSTMLVEVGGQTIKLITKNVYVKSLTDEAGLIAAIGQERTSQFFRQATVLSIDLEKVPEDKQEAFANGVLALAEQLGATGAVTAKQCIQPNPGFHESRTHRLSPAENLAIDAILPVSAYPMLS